jgi:hypothetical protein
MSDQDSEIWTVQILLGRYRGWQNLELTHFIILGSAMTTMVCVLCPSVRPPRKATHKTSKANLNWRLLFLFSCCVAHSLPPRKTNKQGIRIRLSAALSHEAARQAAGADSAQAGADNKARHVKSTYKRQPTNFWWQTQRGDATTHHKAGADTPQRSATQRTNAGKRDCILILWSCAHACGRFERARAHTYERCSVCSPIDATKLRIAVPLSSLGQAAQFHSHESFLCAPYDY